MIRRFLWLRPELLPAVLFAVVPVLVLAGITTLHLFRDVPEAQGAVAETQRSFQALGLASQILRVTLDAERSQRGYLLTGRDEYLEPYKHASQQIGILMSSFQRMVGDRPDQQERLLKLEADLTTKFNELQTTIDAMQASGLDKAREIVDTDVGRRAMEAIDADIGAIRDAADARLAARMANLEQLQRRMNTTALVGTLISILALVIGAVLMGRAYLAASSTHSLLQTTLDSVREGVVAIDGAGRVQASNATLERTLGLPSGAVRRGDQMTSVTTVTPSIASLWSAMTDLQLQASRTGRAALLERTDDRGRTIEIFHSPSADGGNVTTFLDVTDQRSLAEGLRQSQKLEALGQMTGGVAHDFNNLLMVIMGSIGLLRRSLASDAAASKRLDMLHAATERGARMTRQLLAFARRQPLRPETVNLDQLMNEVMPLVRGAVGEEVVVECITAGGLWNTTIDAAQFQSAVINLAINARDAMPGGGKLTIEVANASLDDLYTARHRDVAPGQYVVFCITDTGMGMDAATMARAFDPFFTTKAVGEGTGLGLPQVYGFVKQSGGHVKLYSEVGQGTSIKMYFPRASEPMRRHALEAVDGELAGSETVLVVDDDDIVRETVGDMLEELGYRVVCASSGVEGLDVLTRRDDIDLLFTDVVMPGPIAGPQLAERARALRPTIKVLFTSGYTANAVVHDGRLDPGVDLLSKPYDRRSLATRLRRVLDGGPA